MADVPINEYRIYCTTDARWELYYGPTPPTTCPVNTSHAVNADSVQELRLVGPNTVISQDSAPKKAGFQLTTITMLIPAPLTIPSVVVKDLIFPYNVGIWELSLANVQINVGDVLSIGIGGDTPIAGTTASVAAGATVIPVSGTAFGVLLRGSEIGIQSGATVEHPGIVTALNPTAGTITVSTPLVNSYGPGSAILFTAYVVRDYIFSSTQELIIGRKGLQPRIIPANTPIKFIYTDNTASTQDYTLCFQLQHFYN